MSAVLTPILMFIALIIPMFVRPYSFVSVLNLFGCALLVIFTYLRQTTRPSPSLSLLGLMWITAGMLVSPPSTSIPTTIYMTLTVTAIWIAFTFQEYINSRSIFTAFLILALLTLSFPLFQDVARLSPPRTTTVSRNLSLAWILGLGYLSCNFPSLKYLILTNIWMRSLVVLVAASMVGLIFHITGTRTDLIIGLFIVFVFASSRDSDQGILSQIAAARFYPSILLITLIVFISIVFVYNSNRQDLLVNVLNLNNRVYLWKYMYEEVPFECLLFGCGTFFDRYYIGESISNAYLHMVGSSGAVTSAFFLYYILKSFFTSYKLSQFIFLPYLYLLLRGFVESSWSVYSQDQILLIFLILLSLKNK